MAAPADSVPLSQYVLKVHSRCDLACDHCYIYEHADQSWRGRPHAMSPSIVRAAAARIADHAVTHGLPRVRVVLHGGEPLLLGPDRLERVLSELAAAISPVTRLELRMQTNGVLLSEAICDVLARFDVRVGVSLDGDRAANDRHRRFANGSSSYDRVLSGLDLLRRPEYRRLYAGLLCTVDIDSDPIAVYEALLAQRPPRIDFLLPHATWDSPPPRPHSAPHALALQAPDAPAPHVPSPHKSPPRASEHHGSSPHAPELRASEPHVTAPYAGWLGRVYERWIADGRPVGVRLFESLIATGQGGPSLTEAVGLSPADFVVIETDGAWEQADSLKIAFDGAPATGLTVFRHPVDAVAALPGIAQRQVGLAGLSTTCRECSVVRQCGGGLYAHRYRTGSGFDNPSVYCADLKELIDFMNSRPAPSPAVRALPATMLDQLATGYGGHDVVADLAEAQLSITRALVVAAARGPGDGSADEGWLSLSALDRDPRTQWAVRSVLSHPYVRTWAVGCLSRLRSSAVGHAYLGNIAAAAAIRAGAIADVTVTVHGGAVFLPTVGSVAVPPAGLTATISVSGGGFQLRCGQQVVTVPDRVYARIPGWRPAQWFREDGLEVLIEDADPHREHHQWSTAGRLDHGEMRRWREALSAAWRCIRRDAPGYAAGLRAGLRTITPLRPHPSGMMRSSTARDAFGAAGIALAEPEALAVMIVHEFQHSKLGAVFDLCDLFDAAYAGRLRVGWRTDPRPVEGAFQGAYAHLAVADVWRSRAARGVPGAAEQYRTYRDWTSDAIDALFGSGALTPSGVDFLRRCAETIASWQ